jgi:pyruvate/2-oxoglutarate dehydrogenase complex dihydrolipoamide acyltransferase (E2) component
MEKKISLPRLGETMEIGSISNWLVKEGEEFKRGQIIAEVESDKTTVELPALEDGKLIKKLFQEGEEIEVGADIAIFESI